jgi:hypothetical protein
MFDISCFLDIDSGAYLVSGSFMEKVSDPLIIVVSFQTLHSKTVIPHSDLI